MSSNATERSVPESPIAIKNGLSLGLADHLPSMTAVYPSPPGSSDEDSFLRKPSLKHQWSSRSLAARLHTPELLSRVQSRTSISTLPANFLTTSSSSSSLASFGTGSAYNGSKILPRKVHVLVEPTKLRSVVTATDEYELHNEQALERLELEGFSAHAPAEASRAWPSLSGWGHQIASTYRTAKGHIRQSSEFLANLVGNPVQDAAEALHRVLENDGYALEWTEVPHEEHVPDATPVPQYLPQNRTPSNSTERYKSTQDISQSIAIAPPREDEDGADMNASITPKPAVSLTPTPSTYQRSHTPSSSNPPKIEQTSMSYVTHNNGSATGAGTQRESPSLAQSTLTLKGKQSTVTLKGKQSQAFDFVDTLCALDGPNRVNKMDATLAELERKSRLGTQTPCAQCGKLGSNFPECAKCRRTFCSRACRSHKSSHGEHPQT